MSSANDEKPAVSEAAKGAVATEPAPEETTSELELLDATPTPMVLPVGAPPPPPVRRPPPVPGRTPPPPPPPPRTTQSRPAAPPPPPPPSTVEDPTPAPSAAAVAAPVAAPPSAPRASASMPAVPAARASASMPVAPAPRHSPSPEASPAPPPARVTGAVAVPAAPLPGAALGPHTVPLPTATYRPQPAEVEPFAAEAAIADARKRVEQAVSGERSALARRRTELGLLLEIATGDGADALAEYRAAHGITANLLAPITAARRLTPLRPAAPAIALLEAELQVTQDPAARLTRLLELGMLLATSGAPAERAAQAYRDVLATRPGHVGALRGLESALGPSPRNPESTQQMEALAGHLETMAAAFRGDVRLSAWLEVERGQLLERLGRHDAARAAFEAAIALDGQLGPVRDAYVAHLLGQGQIETLVKAWAAEAALETDPPRAARLLYFAGRLAAERLDQKAQAVELFERAAGDGAAPSIRRAALGELFRLHETMGALDRAATVGAKLLAEARDGERGHWHRRMVPVCEALGRHADMAAHAQQVVNGEPDDEAMRGKLDRALAALGQHAERVAMLTEQAANASTPSARIELLMRAASIAEHDMGRMDLALFSLRSAWAVEPSHPDVTDAIVRLLTPGTPPSLTDPDDPSRVRARIDFYVEAAAAAPDHARKVAHLEKLALIWEDEVRAPERAVSVYGEILAIEPRRRSAILGLARCAARAGNPRELLRALVLEADQSGDDPLLERSLLLRAAEVASSQLGELDTALELTQRVLARSGGDPAALRAAFRAHERAGRLPDALAQLRLLLGQVKKGAPAYAVQAEIARFLEERMHRTADALTAWREAHRLAPANPTARTEIRRILLANGDWRAVAEELAALANAARQPSERGELLLDAAEIYDDRLNDAERAIPLLADAHTCLPDEVAIVERLDRAYLRTHKRAERLALLHATETPHPRCQLAIATLQADERDPGKAIKRVADLASNPTVATAALRMLERALRRNERWSDLALVLRRQIECFASAEARKGSLFELLALEEYGEIRPPDGQPAARELLARLAPDDLLHHELFVRRSGLALAHPVPHRELARALGTLAAAISDAAAAAALYLAAGLLLEHGASPGHQDQKEALLAYAIALEAWPDCVTAARGARRMALRLGETETFVKAAVALGSLELEASARCERLLEAADAIAHASQPKHAGEAFDRVCQALGEDAGSARAADAVIAALAQGADAGKASDALRAALDRAPSPEQAAKLGATLAHVALAELDDPTVALEALRRTRKRAPKHVPTLLALAEVSNALGLHAEAVETASSALAITREPAERLRATVTLAEVHVRTPAFRDTARREATDAEKLFEQAGAGSGELIGRLGGVFRQLGDEASAERVLIAALTLGDSGAALDNLVTMYGSGQEAGERVATALHKVMSQAEVAGKPRRAEWLAALGRVEATMLGRASEGLLRIHEAAVMSPGRLETYQALVDAHGTAHDQAARELLALWPAFARTAPAAGQMTTMVSLLGRVCRDGDRPSLSQVADQLLDFVHQPAAPRTPTAPSSPPVAGCLGRTTLVSAVLHDVMQAPLLDVAILLRDSVDKLIAQAPEQLGLSARDRLTARTSHPVRALADRVARAFGDLRFDVYLGASGPSLGRVVPSDPPALVLPSELATLPELAQVAMVSRLLSYLALDIPWLEELPVADTDGILFGGLRVGSELWGKGELAPTAELAAASWRPRLAKTTSRRTRRNLEDGAQRVRAPADSAIWREAMRIAALRAAFVLTGDLPTVLAQAMTLAGDVGSAHGPALAGKLVAQPLTRELLVFALSDGATALRRAAGTL